MYSNPQHTFYSSIGKYPWTMTRVRFYCLQHSIVGKENEKAITRNQYNGIPHPAQDTKQERNTNTKDVIKWAASWQNQQCGWAPSKDSDQPRHPPDWSESSLCTQWVSKDPSFLHAHSEDSDQTGQVPRLIWVCTGCTTSHTKDWWFLPFVVIERHESNTVRRESFNSPTQLV